MRSSFGSVSGLTSFLLSLTIVAPFSFALPATDGIVAVNRRDAQLPDGQQLYHEHKHQRVYRNDDPVLYLPKLSMETKMSKRAQAGVPSVKSTKVLGRSPTAPAKHYLNIAAEPLPSLQTYPLNIDSRLSDSPQYSSIYNGSGSLVLNDQTKPYLRKLQTKPTLSRDGGLGGKISGRNLFIFADTETYTSDGQWSGFVSNSVASNSGHQSKKGEAPVLHDKLGEFANSLGTMRNWIPFTKGEAAFNARMAGRGQRYAVWPGASLIPIDSQSALLFAPIVFTNIQANPVAKTAGITVARVTLPGRGGAIAERLNPLLFPGEGAVEWGAIGGIRGHGPYGTDGGKVYIFGNHPGGLMLGRVDVANVANSDAYEFWHTGGSWSKNRPGKDSKDNFIDGAFSSGDIFYSPHHSTFIMVYMTPYADNKFYWRYLQSPYPIQPSASEDFVENITKHPWSTPELLLSIPNAVPGLYAYAGGMHRGYFDKNDISVGGNKMLLSWTQPTGKDASSAETGYLHMMAEVTFN